MKLSLYPFFIGWKSLINEEAYPSRINNYVSSETCGEPATNSDVYANVRSRTAYYMSCTEVDK